MSSKFRYWNLQSANSKYRERLCVETQSLDRNIRFAGLADYAGKLRASSYRPTLVPLMDRHETERYALQTVIRARTRGEFEPKLGHQKYVVTVYEKLIRVTITIAHPEKEFHNLYLLLSFDIGSDFGGIIESKVLPFIKQNKSELLEHAFPVSEKYSQYS